MTSQVQYSNHIIKHHTYDLPIFSMRTTHIPYSHMKEKGREEVVEISASNQNHNHRFVYPAARDAEISVEAEGMHRYNEFVSGDNLSKSEENELMPAGNS